MNSCSGKAEQKQNQLYFAVFVMLAIDFAFVPRYAILLHRFTFYVLHLLKSIFNNVKTSNI